MTGTLGKMPALFTQMSIPSKLSMASLPAAATEAGSETSIRVPRTREE